MKTLAADRARRARKAAAAATAAMLAGDPVLRDHPARWSEHPVPWCGGPCPGGETWPCPPVRAAVARVGSLAGAR